MPHLTGRTFPQRISLGAVTEQDWGVEVIETDGGRAKRNQRWAAPLRRFEVAMPIMERSDTDYLALLDLWEDSLGGLHSFDYIDHKDQTDSTTIAVRFATPLRTVSVTPWLESVEPFTLEEVRLPDS